MLFFRKRKNTDRKRSMQSSHSRQQVTLARLRSLRCEPLEDRRMLTVITVNSLGDGPVDLMDGDITLRDAIALAADELSYPGADEIVFDASLGLASSEGSITLTEGPLVVDSALTITGPDAEQLTINVNQQCRVMTIGDPSISNGVDTEITISGLTLAGGKVVNTGDPQIDQSGGGIWSNAVLTLDKLILSGNSAKHVGGGIYNNGTLTVTNSTLLGNSAVYGGGIYNAGMLTIVNSSLLWNSADDDGGGLCNYDTLTITNSILSENSADIKGGGIGNNGTLTVTSSTLSENSASIRGGGICNIQSSSTVILNNTIVAGNAASISGTDIGIDSGTLSGSYNLIGDGTGLAFFNGTSGNIVGTSLSPINPMLSGLIQFDNGQWGHCLLSGSPAIDAGSNALAVDPAGQLLTEDLRGNARIMGDAIDIGAIEGPAPSTPAQTYLVTSLDKTIANDGILTFVEALQAANTNQPVGDASAGSYCELDTIQFASTLTGTTILVDDGPLDRSMTI